MGKALVIQSSLHNLHLFTFFQKGFNWLYRIWGPYILCGFLPPLPFVSCVSRSEFVGLIPKCYHVQKKEKCVFVFLGYVIVPILAICISDDNFCISNGNKETETESENENPWDRSNKKSY